VFAAVAVAAALEPSPLFQLYVPPPVANKLTEELLQSSCVKPDWLVIPAVGGVVLLVIITF